MSRNSRWSVPVRMWLPPSSSIATKPRQALPSPRSTVSGGTFMCRMSRRMVPNWVAPSPVTRPMALLWEAKIEHARGNRAKAELWAKKALREDPAFADAQQFLDELGGS